MRFPFLASVAGAAVCCGLLLADAVGIVPQIHKAAMEGLFPAADKELQIYKITLGVTLEYIEALSWIGRGRLSKNQWDAAQANAGQVRELALNELKTRKLDAEAHLPIALGAAIEVQAQALAAQQKRDEAVLLLNDEIRKWQGTSIVARLQKNLNLLTLEKKPAPELDVLEGIGDVKPLSLGAHRGHPVLVFMWAHWCGDCKAEVDVIQKLQAVYGPRGLVVVAPTQHYGYVAGGEDATRDVETKYIGDVFTKYYSALGKVEVPLSERNFLKLGVSTTPTLLLVDAQGIVRMYHPGALTFEELARSIEPLVAGSLQTRQR